MPLAWDSIRAFHGNVVAVHHDQAHATTEELRAAMVQYQAIFDELPQTPKPCIATAAS